MVLRPLARYRAVAPVTVLAAASATLALRANSYIHAEDRITDTDLRHRKPIYDDDNDNTPSPQTDTNDSSSSLPPNTSDSLNQTSQPSRPTPTDRLAAHVARTRRTLHTYAAQAEDGINAALTEFFRLESSFTDTIASLAPPPSSVERAQLLPGLIYMLVASMAGSIATRNRGFLLRATVPLAAAIGTGTVVLPLTMRNVGGLVWRYEERVPAVRDTHVRVSEEVKRVWETGKAHTSMTVARVEDGLRELREGVEDWIRKGR